MNKKPVFSVVTATFGRGRHIAPTIESVLRQEFTDFELIVVGDGCNDETESVVRSFSDERIVWQNLPENTGSQSFPNNKGIQTARGEWIAYLGHDDIWTPDHLSAMHGVIQSSPNNDFVIAGLVFHTPPGTGIYCVHGLFETNEAAATQFFPPSSVAHRSNIIDQIGLWRDPRSIAMPVDADFFARAATAGADFVSTGKITVHKFAAGHRYLSYLRVDSNEQREMLDAIRIGSVPDTAHMISAARRDGTFMPALPPDLETSYRPGVLFERNRQNKGIARQRLSPLSQRVVIEQTDEGRALDWYPIEQHGAQKFRWSGPNPRPKVLVPYTGVQALVTLETLNSNLDDLSVYVEDNEIDVAIESGSSGFLIIRAQIPLKADDYTVLTLEKPTASLSALNGTQDHRRVGVAIANIIIKPTGSAGFRTKKALRHLLSRALSRWA